MQDARNVKLTFESRKRRLGVGEREREAVVVVVVMMMMVVGVYFNISKLSPYLFLLILTSIVLD